MSLQSQIARQSPKSSTAGIAFIIAGMVSISVNDMLIKQLSGGYPLHQLVFLRSFIGLFFSMMLIHLEGGPSILRTDRPLLQAVRGLLLVLSNLCYFAAIAVMPLADATALFFVAPLFITLLSVPLLGEKIGPLRIGAVVVGFAGVLFMQRFWESAETLGTARAVLALPVVAALTYAGNQVLTRKLGATTKASALAFYVQLTFIVVSLGMWAVAGDGRFAVGSQNPAAIFLLRAWIWPSGTDWIYLAGLGLNATIVGYCLSAAYRLSDAGAIAPFEYVGLPMAVFWGWSIFGEVPGWEVWAGAALIVGSGLFVIWREQKAATPENAVQIEKLASPK